MHRGKGAQPRESANRITTPYAQCRSLHHRKSYHPQKPPPRAVSKLTTQGLLVSYPAIYGAYTELWAGWSPSATTDDSGRYVIPWGRFGEYRADIVRSTRLPEAGGTGVAARFWDWCEKETRQYA